MKKYLIVPVIQTEGMYGYSAIAIECTTENQKEVCRLESIFRAVQSSDSKINELKYYFPTLSFDLLNDEYEIDENEIVDGECDNSYIAEISDEDFDSFSQVGDCQVDSPMLDVMTNSIRITYYAKWSDSKVEGTFDFSVLSEILTK